MRALITQLRGGRLLRRFNLTVHATVNGKAVRIPLLRGIGASAEPLWGQEPWMNAVIAQALAVTPGTFVDVGVNLGQTLLKVKTLSQAPQYVGFEPNPVCVAYVRELITANAFPGCVVAPFGLSDRAGVIPLYARPDDVTDSSATVVPGMYTAQATWAQTPVAVLPGDQALADLHVEQVGVMKIDVEGGELEAIRGLSGTIAQWRPTVLCEILPTYSGRDGRRAFRQPRIEAIVALLRGMDYRIFRLRKDGTLEALETIAPHSDPSQANYAFVPAAAAARFASAFPV